MSDARNNRKVYRGRVVSDKMDKTITVVVETTKLMLAMASVSSTPRSTRHMMKMVKPTLVTLLKLWKLGHCLQPSGSA